MNSKFNYSNARRELLVFRLGRLGGDQVGANAWEQMKQRAFPVGTIWVDPTQLCVDSGRDIDGDQ